MANGRATSAPAVQLHLQCGSTRRSAAPSRTAWPSRALFDARSLVIVAGVGEIQVDIVARGLLSA
jgi:alkylation response protein AidB-like acyl-CoA dehydrogenase